MKIRFLIAACFALLLGLPADSRAVLPPRQPALPNFDKRVEAIQQNAGAPAQQQPLALQNQSSALSTEALALQAKAEADLKSHVQGLKIERDPILGMPKFISATRGFLTGPEGKGGGLMPQAVDAIPATDPHRPIKAFLNAYAPIFGHNARALETARIKRDYVTEHNGLRTVIWEQMVNDIPVFEGLLAGHITKRGELVNIYSRFVPDPAQAAKLETPGRAELIRSPAISARQAIVKAAANLGTELEESSLGALGGPEGAESRQAFTAPLLRGEVRVKLVWLPMNRNSLRLAWRIELSSRARPELYSVVVDAQTGEPMLRRSLTSYLTDASYRVYTSDSPTPFSPGHSTPSSVQPPEVQRKLVKFSAISTNASPKGWINDGDNETRGNNVDAHTDRNDDDQPDLPRPRGTPNRVFDFPLDLKSQPTTYTNAAIVNLFYWNNFMHDKLYELGFTEAAGNFQYDNFDRGGQPNDAVQADAQDGGGFDNANFGTPPDGSQPRMQMYIFSGPDPNRDGDLDAEIICHEYTHGLSNRLVGGDVGISELQPSGMGEGWSDFYGLSLLSEPTDNIHGNYAAGGYATYKLDGLTQNYYFGIRRYPYTTDMTKNPLTLRDIDPSQADLHPGIPISPIFGGLSPADEVHNQGEVWCVTLWEARANLIDKLGFAEGNQTILQLVTDGMKLSPANPTFLEARDAIIQADEINSGGDNRSELWLAFAKRGMGFSASVPNSDTTIGVGEAFDVPDDVLIGVPDGQLEITITPRSGSVIFAGTSQPIFVRVTDGLAVTNATITATVSGGGTLVFKNDGVDPDKTPGNSVYSGSLIVPTNASSITITLVITAPGEDTSTNSVAYSVIPIPANDNFANAIKVPNAGAVYLSNNKLATIEPDEPKHGGLPKAGASLWWLYSPSIDTDLLIDTAGSAFDTVIAVYTGSSLKTLQSVISADNIGTRKQAFLTLHATKGIAYHIAVASANTNGTGTLNLRFAPGGQPDFNPPVVSVTSPPSGLVLATNRVVVTGTAFDPQPFASGIDKILIRVNTRLGAELSDQTETENGLLAQAVATAPDIILNTNWTRIVALREGLNIIQVTASDIAGNLSDPISMEVTYRPLDPLNDIFANAIPLTQNSGTNLVNTVRATKEFGEPQHANNDGGKSVWWSFRPTADGVLSLSTTNSNFDTLLAAYTGTRVNALTAIAANDDAFDGSGFSQVDLGVAANQTYYIAVDGFSGASGAAYLEYSFTSSSLFSLSVSSTPGGTVNLGTNLVGANTTMVLTATPDIGFDFIGWTGSTNSQENPLSVVVNSNLSLVAGFAPRDFSDDFESGGLTELPWTNSGDAPWRVEAATPRSGPGNGSATRQLPLSYVPNRPLTVTITATPAASVSSYSVSDQPPLGWIVTSIDNNGKFDLTARRVTWGPFFDHQQRTLTYRILPPGDATGVASFNGTAKLDGVSSAITGDLDTVLNAARSGQIADGQQSSLILAMTLPAGSASFDLRVSSERGWDFLEFYINDVLVQRWSGEVGWQAYEFEVPAGTTSLVWRYRKDTSISVGLDAAFIDNIQLPTAGPPVSGSQLRLTSGPSAEGAVRVQLRGQSGQEYVIQASSNLIQWESIGNGVAIDGVISFVDKEAGKHSLRYYRAVTR
jgi:hypothetical protein